MADYTVRNLKDVHDSAPDHGMAPMVEARFGGPELGAEQTGFSYQRFAPGYEQSFAHRHGDVEELYLVLSGGGRAHLDGETVDLRPLDVVRCAPHVVRSFAAGPDGLELLAFGPHGDMANAEMLPPVWGA
ncbi:MAG: cupin domain-containing protein [Thermoleophilia bacterium]